MELMNIDYKSLNAPDLYNEYFVYSIDKTNIPIKKLCKIADLSFSTYAAAKKRGRLIDSKSVTLFLGKYLNVNLAINERMINKLTILLDKSIYSKCYLDKKEKDILDDLNLIKENCINSPLMIYYALISLFSSNYYSLSTPERKSMESECINLLDKICPYLDNNLRYLIAVCETEWYLKSKNEQKTKEAKKNIEEIEPFASDSLKSIGYSVMMNYYLAKGNYISAKEYLEKGEANAFKYFNSNRLLEFRKSLTYIHFKNKDFISSSVMGSSLVNILNKENTKIEYINNLIVTAFSFIYIAKYEEAEKYIKLFFDSQIESSYPQAYLLLAICKYKTKDYDAMNNFIDKINNLDIRIASLIGESIKCLANGKAKKMKEFSERIKPLYLNNFASYDRIISFLVDEYEDYLKRKGKYLTVFDM